MSFKEFTSFIGKLWGGGEKREWYALERRAKTLPEDYRAAYKAMQRYMWTTGTVSNWADSKFVFEELLDLLEDAVADGKKVTEITGSDVAAFCDELRLKSSDWRDKYRERLNKEVSGK